MSTSDTDTTTTVLTPTGLASRIRRRLLELGEGRIEGEVRNLSRSGGHCYFAIADEESLINCIVWGRIWDRLEHQPSEGDQIEAHFGKVDFYGRYGKLSLHVDTVELAGEGRFLARQAQVLARLTADGLCPAHRPPLPRFPRKVGVIAAATGEARVDVLTALQQRFPPVQIVFCPAAVQGTSCVGSVIDALATLDAHPEVDVIVLARGGGSASDLYPFSDERLCRTIAALRTPVVTSIGHTRQRPNCDHVAAASAPVPAVAAALVVPDAADLQARLASAVDAFTRASERVREQRARADSLWRPLAAHDPPAEARLRLEAVHGRLATLEAELPHRRRLTDQHTRLERASLSVSHRIDTLGGRLLGNAQRLHQETTAYRETTQRHHTLLQQQLQAAAANLAGDLRERRAGLARQLPLLDELATTSVETARTALNHRRELIDALDWRRRGLARLLDPTGRPVHELSQIDRGDDLTIELLGGSADATITAVHPLPPTDDEGGTP